MLNLGWLLKTVIPILALLLSLAALSLDLRRDLFVRLEVTWTPKELEGYPVSDPRLSLAVGRAELPGLIRLHYGIEVRLRSTGNRPAVNVQARVKAGTGSYIVQIHTDDTKLVERLPGLGRQGSPEVFVTVPLMVPGEELRLTFWYGVPDKPETRPETPTVLIRHSEGLGKRS